MWWSLHNARDRGVVTICGMSTSENNPIEWPRRDLRRTVKVIITPLSEYAIIPMRCQTCNIGLEISSLYCFTVEPFRTVQAQTDLLIKLPTGVTGRILELSKPGSVPLHVQQETIPSNFGNAVEISVKNTIDKAVTVERGCKLARMIPTTYYQPEILVKLLQLETLVPPNTPVVPLPLYGHQHVTTMTPMMDSLGQVAAQPVSQDQQFPNGLSHSSSQGQGDPQTQHMPAILDPQNMTTVPLQGGLIQSGLPPMSTLLSSLVNPTMVTQQNGKGVTTIVSPLSNLPMQHQ